MRIRESLLINDLAFRCALWWSVAIDDTGSKPRKPGEYPRKLSKFGGALELPQAINLFIALVRQKYSTPLNISFPPHYPTLHFTFLLDAQIITSYWLPKHYHYLTPLYPYTIYYYQVTGRPLPINSGLAALGLFPLPGIPPINFLQYLHCMLANVIH